MRGDRPSSSTKSLAKPRFTPHARGSTLRANPTSRSIQVYPACAGIELDVILVEKGKKRLPRMRGDRPLLRRIALRRVKFTPHARGSTSIATIITCCSQVYPACAGIDLIIETMEEEEECLPRMRGDRPVSKFHKLHPPLFTPHARGSTYAEANIDQTEWVYPACAGIDRQVVM